MKDKLLNIKQEAIENLKKVDNLKDLDGLRVKYLGKKGELTTILKGMGKLSKEERPIMGQLANEVRSEIENNLKEIKDRLEKEAKNKRLSEEKIDITVSKKNIRVGHRHPLLSTIDELEDLFVSMGFKVINGPEIDTVDNNFDKLNSPANHPSRDLSDTFYINEDILLRTHTSPVQVRAMQELGAPLRMVSAGRTFRFDDVDDTHSPMFHQLEGLVIDENVSMADLKGTLELFCKKILGEKTNVRFRPSFFPFTEPSVEVDVTCFKCGGKGCPLCKQTGWIEVLGAGMVHPNVLEMSGYDSTKYQGFAFGTGMDRFAMFKYGIPDIRTIYGNDIRFIEQFDRKDNE